MGELKRRGFHERSGLASWVCGEGSVELGGFIAEATADGGELAVVGNILEGKRHASDRFTSRVMGQDAQEWIFMSMESEWRTRKPLWTQYLRQSSFVSENLTEGE